MELTSQEETKVIYHIDDEETPYLVKLSKPPDEVTLADFKEGIPVHFHRYKFFFKSKDDDFGVVKEEILDDQAKLPLFNGRVVSWLVASEGSVVSQASHHHAHDFGQSDILALPLGLQREAGVGETRPPSFHGGPRRHRDHETETESLLSSQQEYYDDTESSITSVSQIANARRRRDMLNRGSQQMSNGHRRAANHRPPPLPGPGIPPPSDVTSLVGGGTVTETSSMLSSEIESSIGDDTEDIQSVASSRFTTSTDHTSVSRQMAYRQRLKKKSRRKIPPHLPRAGSMSSVTDSTVSLNIITVTLNMDTVNFLGISIVGQSNKYDNGDCGIYVGSIMKGGAVALDGRIEPGDMILQVNDFSFENMSNDDAVKVLREVVQKPGPIRLVVAKCWDPSPSNKGYFTLPKTEPVRPIDPGAWVAHTAAVRGDFPGRAASVTTLSASSVVSSHADTEKFVGIGPAEVGGTGLVGSGVRPPSPSSLPLTVNSGMAAVTRAMQKHGSGLEVRDRMWLKIKISNAFIGSDAVDWIYGNVEGFEDRREARKYVAQMLKDGFIKHTVNKTSFSEQCYYTFWDENALTAGFKSVALNEGAVEPLPPPVVGPHVLPTSVPLTSGGSGGSGGIMVGQQGWAAPPNHHRNEPSPHQWDMPWAGPGSGSGSTTYGAIYNPAAPPPSANYTAMSSNYSGHGSGHESTYGAPGHTLPVHHSSGSSHQSETRLQLAGSGSGSESGSSVTNRRLTNLAKKGNHISSGEGSLMSQHHPQAIFH